MKCGRVALLSDRETGRGRALDEISHKAALVSLSLTCPRYMWAAVYSQPSFSFCSTASSHWSPLFCISVFLGLTWFPSRSWHHWRWDLWFSVCWLIFRSTNNPKPNRDGRQGKEANSYIRTMSIFARKLTEKNHLNGCRLIYCWWTNRLSDSSFQLYLLCLKVETES